MREAILARLRVGMATRDDFTRLHGYDWIMPMGELVRDGLVEVSFTDGREVIYALKRSATAPTSEVH